MLFREESLHFPELYEDNMKRSNSVLLNFPHTALVFKQTFSMKFVKDSLDSSGLCPELTQACIACP